MTKFGDNFEDGSVTISDFAIKQNTSYLELYDWQRRAIDFFFDYNKAIFEATTGAGKTFCVIEILKRIWKTESNLYVLIVVPKNVILETGWYSELYNASVGLPDIGVYYGFAKEYSKVTITNMQNLGNIALDIFDVIIWDEVHNYGTERLLPFIKMDFKYKIGLSATLERMDDNHYKIMAAFDYNVFSYTPKQALVDGVLNPFNFSNIFVEMEEDDFETYLRLTKEYNMMIKSGGSYNKIMRGNSGLKFKVLTKMNERKGLVNNYYKKCDVVKWICEKHRNDKIIIFSEYNKTTNDFYWSLLDTGTRARVIHSDISADMRDKALSDFKNNRANVLLVTRALDEGTNIPKLDVAIIAAGNSTSRQTVQRLGRVLRKKNKESSLYQVFVKRTMEEDYAKERSALFKELCSNYKEYYLDDNNNVVETFK